MPEPHKRANRHPKYTTAYRVNNWPEYDKSLRNRGDITLWISQDAIDAWIAPKTGKRGPQLVYADLDIETALTFKLLFRLLLRQTEGFLHSILTRCWCMNRLNPSGELRAGFGEACEVAADTPPISHGIIGLREHFCPPAPCRSAGHTHGLGMLRGAIDYACTKAFTSPCSNPMVDPRSASLNERSLQHLDAVGYRRFSGASIGQGLG